MILTCGETPILGVVYASYGIAKGKCSDGDWGSGSSWTFDDVTKPGPDAAHPTCGCLDVMSKITELCVGKPSCTIDGTQANSRCLAFLPATNRPCRLRCRRITDAWTILQICSDTTRAIRQASGWQSW